MPLPKPANFPFGEGPGVFREIVRVDLVHGSGSIRLGSAYVTSEISYAMGLKPPLFDSSAEHAVSPTLRVS